MLLTVSLALVSINSPLTSRNAQNNPISQSGNGDDAEPETGQSPSSEQNVRVVSGDSSIASGNNILYEDQNNSDDLQVLDEICNLDEMNPHLRLHQLIMKLYWF